MDQTKFGIIDGSKYGSTTAGFILPQYHMTLNQGVWNPKSSYFRWVFLLFRALQALNLFFLIEFSPNIKVNYLFYLVVNWSL